MKKKTTWIKAIMLCSILLIPLNGITEDAYVKGTVYIVSPESNSPIPASSYRVNLYNTQQRRSLNPSVTDAYGRFAFFGLNEGNYVLEIVQTAENWTHRLWLQDVSAPTKLEPIVLSQLVSIVPRAQYTKVNGSQDLYDFSLWLDMPNIQNSQINKVTYEFNHPSFNNKIQASTDPSNGFKVGYRGWGCLSAITIKIQRLCVESQIIFNMCKALDNF